MDDPDIATAAASGVTYPKIAKGTATTLYATAMAKFCRTSRPAFRAIEIARGTADRLSRRNTRSAALRPTSAAEAGAIDACAAASAGASFSPSPIISTFRPAASSAAMCATFRPGNTAAKWGTPSSAAINPTGDRKSTRLNSSHITISYAVFCLKKKKKNNKNKNKEENKERQKEKQ